MALKFGGEIDWRAVRWMIAERMHWPLEYVDALDAQDVLDGLYYWYAGRVIREEERRSDMPEIMQGLA